jgi:sugar phosphate isomerase/epimerase
MELGIFAKTFPRPTLEETLDAVVSHGLKHVQFNLSCAGMTTLPDRLEQGEGLEIAKALRDRGLTMSAISGTFNPLTGFNLLHAASKSNQKDFHKFLESGASGFPHIRRDFEALNRLASCCRWLETPIITISTGTRHPGDNIWKWHEANVTRRTWDAVIDAMRMIVEIAERNQVVMAFEPELGNVVDSVCKARRLLDAVGSPWLKIVLDPANLIRPGDIPRMRELIEEAFDWLGDDIALVHVKELGADGQVGDIAPGQGILDYGFIMNELERIGYNGTLIMHGLSESQVEPGVKFLRKMMGFSKGTREPRS